MLFYDLNYYYYTEFSIKSMHRLYHKTHKRYIRCWIWIWLVLVQMKSWFSSYKTSFLDSLLKCSLMSFSLLHQHCIRISCRGPPAWLTGRWFHFNLGSRPQVDPVLTRASQVLTASRPTNRGESWHVSACTHSLPVQRLFDWMHQIVLKENMYAW